MEQKLENVLKNLVWRGFICANRISFTSVCSRTYPHYRDKNVWWSQEIDCKIEAIFRTFVLLSLFDSEKKISWEGIVFAAEKCFFLELIFRSR